MTMLRIRLIHWNAAEAEKRAAKLRSFGYDVDFEPFTPAALNLLRQEPPTAVVIDLTRLPSQGGDVGVALRKFKATRHVPLVFVEGDPEKVARIKHLLPDAAYTSWSRIRSSMHRAIAEPPAEPVVPRSTMEGYAGAPLAKKLGIKPGSIVVLIGAPSDFEGALGALPEGVTLRRQNRGRRDLTIWFTRSRKDLHGRIEPIAAVAGENGLWIAWPKKTSALASDLSQAIVREVGLAAGWVDYKVCAIDETWSGLKFTRRRAK